MSYSYLSSSSNLKLSSDSAESILSVGWNHTPHTLLSAGNSEYNSRACQSLPHMRLRDLFWNLWESQQRAEETCLNCLIYHFQFPQQRKLHQPHQVSSEAQLARHWSLYQPVTKKNKENYYLFTKDHSQSQKKVCRVVRDKLTCRISKGLGKSWECFDLISYTQLYVAYSKL